MCAGARGRNTTAAGTGFGASSLATVMQMVASGYGVTLISQIAADVERRDERVKFLRLKNPEPGRSIGLVFRRTSPRKADLRRWGSGEGECEPVHRTHHVIREKRRNPSCHKKKDGWIIRFRSSQ